MEWVVAVAVMFVVSAVAVGLPVLALTRFWDARRRARRGRPARGRRTTTLPAL